MASDSREEQAVTAELPAELDEWLDDRADALGVDRGDVIVQLLASYHAVDSLDGHLDPNQALGEDASAVLDVEGAVDAVIENRGEDVAEEAVATAVERELADRLADEVEAATEEHLPTVTDAVEGRLEDRIDEIVAERLDRQVGQRIDERVEAVVEETVEAVVEETVEDRIEAFDAAFQEKIVDVRERVIQVKKEADSKAPADHDHDAFEEINTLERRLADLAATIDQLEATVEGVRSDVRDEVDGVVEEHAAIDERLSDTEDKLKRVAWVVSDVKDAAGGKSAHEQAVTRIKHAAAQEGVTAADCERCGEAVEIGLLTDPECPHCNATVSDVRPTGGIFRKKAKLVAAAQLESGEE